MRLLNYSNHYSSFKILKNCDSKNISQFLCDQPVISTNQCLNRLICVAPFVAVLLRFGFRIQMSKQVQLSPLKLLKEFLHQLIATTFESNAEEDKHIEKFILSSVVPLDLSFDAILQAVKQALTDPDLSHPRKYVPLLYLSLIEVGPEKVSDLFKFYYELTSHAIKELREGKHALSPSIWDSIFEKVYQYGMLLLIGSRSILLSIERLGMRVNSQQFAEKAKEMRLSRIVKIYNCMLCLPEQFLTLKHSLYLTLIFTRWELQENSLFTPSFFASFTLKTQRKLIRKLKLYPTSAFNQQHILNLVKIILGGDELVFSYYLQVKYTYEALKADPASTLSTDKSVFQALRKCPVIRESRHLFNFLMQLLVSLRGQEVLKNVERQSIIFVSLKYLSGKFQNNENLYVMLARQLLYETNPVITHMSFRFLREEGLQFLTVHKLKLLLNAFNVENWTSILKEGGEQGVVLAKLQRVLGLLGGMARRYSESSLVLYCSPANYGLSIFQAKNAKSLILVVSFDCLGRLNQQNLLQMKILRLTHGRDVYEMNVTFSESMDSLRMQSLFEPKERSASLVIRLNGKQLVNERKQYIRYSQGCFQSFIAVSLEEKKGAVAFCVDGAYFQFKTGRKAEFNQIEAGCMAGSIRTFYALKCELQLVNVYKTWCERSRKAKYVIEGLGFQNIVYRINNRDEPVLLDTNAAGFSFFHAKTAIKIQSTPLKHVTFIDILLQLGGLETIFFIMERFSRSLMQFRDCKEKINALIADFFGLLRTAGVLDESNALLGDITQCFKYLNQFLFLLIKRNRIVRESRNSFLLLSIFQLLVYFRHCPPHRLPQNVQARTALIETNLILRTLANFQIWSHCSIALQLFVLSEIEAYIKERVHCETLVKEDLHRELLSSLILFQTSDKNSAYYPEVQNKIIMLCMQLYESSKEFLVDSPDRFQKDREFNTFVERDINTCFTFLKFMLTNCMDRRFSQSQRGAFALLTKYVNSAFIERSGYFKLVGRTWSALLNVLTHGVEELSFIDRTVLQSAANLIVHVVSQQQGHDVWVLRYMEAVIFNSSTSFSDCLYVLACTIARYVFQTPRKHTIFSKLLVHMKDKIEMTSWGKEEVKELRLVIERSHPIALYYLSTCHQFAQLLEAIRVLFLKGEAEKEERQAEWNLINSFLLEQLYKERRITNKNAQFVKCLVESYVGSRTCPYIDKSLGRILDNLAVLRQQAKECHRNDNPFMKYDIRSAFALIEHCRSWPTMQFLMSKGLLTIQNDLPIPFRCGDVEVGSIGGTVGYYLSKSSQPLELFVLFNVILYRQLSNNLTILTTQANIAIFQYSLEFLLDKGVKGALHDESLWLNVAVLVLVLREVMKLLNNSFINKTSSVFKDIDKILNKQSEAKGRRGQPILQSLSKASQRMQAALEDTKIDKDMAAFIELISCKLTLIHEKDEKQEIISIVAQLAEELKAKNWSAHEQQFKKLSILGIRFFMMARQYYLSRHSEHIKDQSPQRRLAERIPELGREREVGVALWNSLTEKFDSILEELSERGKEAQTFWSNLLITNEHWFDLQEDPNDITTKFYELDQKETGPFGLYKLNIRPVRSDHEKLPYPRKKDYSEMRGRKEQMQRQKEESLAGQRLTIQFKNPTLFSTLAETGRQRSRLTEKMESQSRNLKERQKEKEYFCEYVTKRGVYGGVLVRKRNCLEFRFTGHAGLPEDRVYQTSTNKCHRIEQLSEWESKELQPLQVRLAGSKVFTRRYIMRHTAFELFHPIKHRSYFFNLFFPQPRQNFLAELRNAEVEIIENRQEEFAKAGFTQKWQKGELSNFQYLGLVNRYSGRTTNDLGQYPVMPWVITNYNGANNFRELDKDFYNNKNNLRDLTLPTGKLNSEKFSKLKARLRQVDASDREIRFLYGTMYSNPTVLYNFFIRLQPFTSLHWEHQGRKIDHADRLFSGIHQQFNTILTSSSDMKELAPEFYYWTQFLRNRNRIDLGRKQRGDDVDAVVLPVWARSPEEFCFKMREVLESREVSEQLHQWIDLIFGKKVPITVAEEYDNLYHYQCYEHDIFQDYETENQMRIAQIAISEFGQVAEPIFSQFHPPRHTRKKNTLDLDLDIGILVHRIDRAIGFQYNEAGLMIWSEESAIFKKVAIAGLYNSFEWSRQFPNKGRACVLTSVNLTRWVAVTGGVLRVIQRGKAKMERAIESRCLDVMGNYVFYASGSKVVILEMGNESLSLCNTLYGHRDEVILIKADFVLDVIMSVDRSGYVLVHELTELRFLRAFQLGTNFEKEEAFQLRACLHRMGYFIFLDHEQTLWIFNYMGELLLDQDLEVRSAESRQDEQRITQMQIFSHQHALLLLASSKGNVFRVNFLDIIRFKQVYPFKTFSRLGRNILEGVRSKSTQMLSQTAIRQFNLVKTVGQKSVIYQLLVLYESGELVCYTQQREMGEQLKTNPRLKSMGFF